MRRKKHSADKSHTPPLIIKKITIRPTEDQLAILNRRAASFGYKSLSKYLIERGTRPGEMIENIDRERLERLLFEVRKVGVNINQIAREMHRGYSEYSQSYLDRAMQQVERVTREISEEVQA